MKGKIPIRAAKEISEKYKCPMVLVFGIEEGGDRFTITTYGASKALCRHAASMSRQFSEAVMNATVAPCEIEPIHLPDAPEQLRSIP